MMESDVQEGMPGTCCAEATKGTSRKYRCQPTTESVSLTHTFSILFVSHWCQHESRYCDEVHKQRLGIILIWRYICDNSCLFVWSTCDNSCLFVWSTVYAARQGMMAYNNNTMCNPPCIFYKDKEVFLRVFVECIPMSILHTKCYALHFTYFEGLSGYRNICRLRVSV